MRAASRWSSSMRARALSERDASWNRRRSSPSSRANRSYASGESSRCEAKSRSCICQNLPCSRAASAAFAAGRAFGWNGERLVLPGDPHLVAVRALHLVERRADAGAERALEVGEEDDGDRRARVAAHRVVGPELDRADLRRGPRRRATTVGAAGRGAAREVRLAGLVVEARAGTLRRRGARSALFSSSSATARSRSKGCAPTTWRQLKNIVGVPFAPTWPASFWSSWMRASPRRAAIACSNRRVSSPSSFA